MPTLHPTGLPEADVPLLEGISREFLLHHRVCPKSVTDDGVLLVAAAPSAQLDAIDDLAFAYKRQVVTIEASQAEIEQLIERLSTAADRALELTVDDSVDEGMADTRDLASQPPVIRYVNLLIREAYDCSASDIHLEATRTGISTRFRMDGVLAAAPAPPANLHQAVVSRVKLLAELDIAERRRPQDGRIRVRLESRELDLRVSTVPTMFGESVVLRLLDRGGRPVALEELGLSAGTLEAVERLASRPHGMLLVTGPTGSGKTTTLYACLQRRPTGEEKIVTVEDPVEYQLGGVTQVPVHRQAGVTFSSALRSILRQDPDVVMIGEMRDSETAEIAVQAAMTGHLVFSTLHTNDAISALPRLFDLGVPPYLASATLEGVLAQRLVRRVCDVCRTTYDASAESVAMLCGGPGRRTRLQRGAGCAACRGTGFRGRLGIFELLLVTDELKDLISRGASRLELRDAAVAQGMLSMATDGWGKAQAGLTTVEEVLRVTQTH
jgi:general secretion pathway protein E